MTLEIQTQERGGRFGYVLTRTVHNAVWTSEWVEVASATCHAEVRPIAKDAVALLERKLQD